MCKLCLSQLAFICKNMDSKWVQASSWIFRLHEGQAKALSLALSNRDARNNSRNALEVYAFS